ncbi:MAG: 50S ribosomal protein L4 [Patescibacteria group bacterium]|nr:50S ribosomal protein L4 [Patescibacteria group bacterium]MDE2144679.1 50S ribosomal protein L4 [Patescibacteria group bacterium]
MKLDVYNKTGEVVGNVEAPDRVFNRKWNSDLVNQALRAQENNSRQNLAHAKTRSEVSGGGRKPWRQKHTGRSRQGSSRSPIWVHGGVAHGPTKEKDYSVKLNKKMRQAAIFSLLSKKLADGELKVIDSLNLGEKTKLAHSFLTSFFNKIGRDGKKVSVLLIPNSENRVIYRAARNIPSVKSLDPISINVYDLLRYRDVLLDKESISVISKHYNAGK